MRFTRVLPIILKILITPGPFCGPAMLMIRSPMGLCMTSRFLFAKGTAAINELASSTLSGPISRQISGPL